LFTFNNKNKLIFIDALINSQ